MLRNFCRGLKNVKSFGKDAQCKLNIAHGHRFSSDIACSRESSKINKVSNIFRPVVFASTFTLGGLTSAAILREERSLLDNKRINYFKFENPSSYYNCNFVSSLRATDVVTWGIVALNVAVFGLWRISGIRKPLSSLSGRVRAVVAAGLERNFLHFPSSGRGVPMLGACFSHMDLPHLGFNMYALHSFAPSFILALGPEMFVATYLSAGVLSSLGGLIVKLARGSSSPSLGASGCILFLAASTALLSPDSEFQIMFIPYPIRAEYCLIGLVALDLAGLIFRWRMLDHGVHLAATALAVGYIHLGGYKSCKAHSDSISLMWRQWRMKNKI